MARDVTDLGERTKKFALRIIKLYQNLAKIWRGAGDWKAGLAKRYFGWSAVS